MESSNYEQAVVMLNKASHVRVVFAIIQCHVPKMAFDEQVEFYDLCLERLNKIYGIEPINERGF